MAVYREESLSVTRLRRDIGVETETHPAVSASTEERGGAAESASQPQSDSVFSSSPTEAGREWHRVGDCFTGRYDSSQGLW